VKVLSAQKSMATRPSVVAAALAFSVGDSDSEQDDSDIGDGDDSTPNVVQRVRRAVGRS
jgi:hypothetical protein